MKRLTLTELKASGHSLDEKRDLITERLRRARARAEQLCRDPSAPDALRSSAEDTLFALDLMNENDKYARLRLDHYQRQTSVLMRLSTRLLGYLAKPSTQADEAELMQMHAELEVAQADLVVHASGGLFAH